MTDLLSEIESRIEAYQPPHVNDEETTLQTLRALKIALGKLEQAEKEYWNRCYSGSNGVKAMTVNEFEKFIQEALTQIAKELGITT
jgi:hypothetical protein